MARAVRNRRSQRAKRYVGSFSDEIIDGENDDQVWISRLNEVKEKFTKRFGSFERSDFFMITKKKNPN